MFLILLVVYLCEGIFSLNITFLKIILVVESLSHPLVWSEFSQCIAPTKAKYFRGVEMKPRYHGWQAFPECELLQDVLWVKLPGLYRNYRLDTGMSMAFESPVRDLKHHLKAERRKVTKNKWKSGKHSSATTSLFSFCKW